jgi:APA family basic amino acid/polyamine antiporter
MMYSLGRENWVRLFVWLVLGLLIYFGYGRTHSALGRRAGKVLGAGISQRFRSE